MDRPFHPQRLVSLLSNPKSTTVPPGCLISDYDLCTLNRTTIPSSCKHYLHSGYLACCIGGGERRCLFPAAELWAHLQPTFGSFADLSRVQLRTRGDSDDYASKLDSGMKRNAHQAQDKLDHNTQADLSYFSFSFLRLWL